MPPSPYDIQYGKPLAIYEYLKFSPSVPRATFQALNIMCH